VGTGHTVGEIMKTRRNAAVIVLSFVLITGALPGLSSARAQNTATDLATICPAKEQPIEIEEDPRFLAAVPTGIAITALARDPALQLPEGADFVLSLDYLTLGAGNEAKSRRTVGPTLFLIEAGVVAVIDSGRARQPAGRAGFGPGESVLVEQNRLVKLENNGNEPGSVLLLGLLPPEGQLPIGPFGAPASIWIPFPEEHEQLTHRQVLTGDLGGLAREETLLFVACLHWTDSAAEIAPTSYPGPVGLLVLRGQAQVNETERIGAGECWLSPGFTTLHVRAGDMAPDIVLFGALRTSAQPRIAESPGDASSSLDCVGPTAAEDT
jgi:hypothetical protein